MRESWSSNPKSSGSQESQPAVSLVPQIPPGGLHQGYPLGVVSKLKVFVGGLAQTTTEDEMRDYFSVFGSSVAEVEIKIDKMTGRSRGFGFVTILGCDSNRLFNTSHKLSNKAVDVAEVTETKVVVGNLKLTTTQDQVISHFARYGNILTCDLSLTHGQTMTVVFESAEAASNALAESSHFIDGVKVEVRKAEPNRLNNNNSRHVGNNQYIINKINHQRGLVYSAVSTTVNTPVMSGISLTNTTPGGYGAFGGYGEFEPSIGIPPSESHRILARLEYGALGTPSSYGVYPVPGYDMVPGLGTTNRYHPIGL